MNDDVQAEDKLLLPEKLKRALEKQGYPLEMETAKAFQDAGFDIGQSFYYDDPETGDAREIDVVAHAWRDYKIGKTTVELVIQYAIECKKTTHPWVIFTNSSKSILRRDQYAHSKLGASVLFASSHDHEIMDAPLHEWHGSYGYSLAQISLGNNGQSGNSDAPYKALMSSTKAAFFFATHADESAANRAKDTIRAALVVPVIAFDGPLFQAQLTKTGELDLKETDEGIVFSRYPISGKKGSKIAVRVVRKNVINRFAAKAKETCRITLDSSDMVEHALNAYNESLPPRTSEFSKAVRKSRTRLGGRSSDST